ncbi:MAG: hypothetical protein JWO53_488 [Chlamydiia bacterium]|nr:hypothetical protein [Chlamydiia bacterium]
MIVDLEKLPIDVTEHITKFRDFLCTCWPSIDSLMVDHDWDDDGDFIDDWLGANWELLVERELLHEKGFLTSFGMLRSASRVISPSQKATYSVYVKSKSPLFDMKKPMIPVPTNQKLRLYSFRASEKDFGLYPPFDVAAVVVDASKKFFYVPFKELQFYIDLVGEGKNLI